MAFCSGHDTPSGSFLRNSVSTPDELSLAVSVDRIVAARYERYYHMSADKISEYFRTNLTEGTLKHAGTYTVSFIDGNRIVSHRVRLQAGEEVFFASGGIPVIEVRCGNPISAALPSSPVRSASAAGAKAEREDSLTSSDAQPASTDVAEIITPEYEKTEVAGIQQVSELTAVPATTVETLGRSGLNLTELASGLASLGALSMVSSKKTHNTPPVPEPSALLVLVGGVGSVISATLGRTLRRRS
jgi:hypothetical protein